MNTKNLLTLSLLAFCSLAASAQTSLKGKVLDDKNKGVEFATVMLLNPADSALVKGAITDSAGVYAFAQIQEGNYLLSASMMGYDKGWAGPVKVRSSGSQQLPALELVEMVEQLKAVTVVGKKPMIEQQADRLVVNVEGSILATGGTALEVLEKSPGITVDQNGNISLNGKQGVTVMIDGKRTYLSSADVSSMLKNMPSDALEKVELITSPSAKYDAAGNSGIINIKTKKGRSNGTNGSLTLGAGHGRFEKFNGGLRLNHRQNKVNLFGSYNFSRNLAFQDLTIDRKAVTEEGTYFFNQQNYMPNRWQGHSYKAGADFFLNKKNTLGLMINGSFGNWSSNNENQALQTLQGTGADIFMTTLGKFDENHRNTTVNFNYQRSFEQEGRELTFDLDFSNYRGRNDNNFNNRFRYYDGRADSVFLLRNSSPSDINIWVAKLDYILPVGKSKIEMGAKSSLVNSDNNARIEKQENEAQWQLWDKFSNDFLYKENINAAYANWSGAIGKTTLMGGLRAEHTWYQGESVKHGSKAANGYLSLFPSLFVQHPLNEKNTFGLSYSRRVDRPSYQDLNPFFNLLDVVTYSKGNPNLLPQFTHQLQLSHTFNQAIVTNLSYSITDGPMTQVLETEGRDAFQTNRNLGTLINWSLNMSVPIPVAKWWQMQNNLSVYRNKYKGQYLQHNLDLEQTTANLHIMNSFKLPANFSAELSGFYQSPQLWGIVKSNSMYSLNAGVQYSFWDSNASLKLSANDIFRTMKFSGESIVGENKIIVSNSWESQRLNLSFNYRFGNKEAKTANRRRGASSDEQGRIKGSGN